VQEATDMVGISRSSFYKYKDDIFPFHDNAKGKTITIVMQMDDEPGLLSLVLRIVADFHANILTIHQSIPVNGIASLTLSVDVLPDTKNVSQMIENIEQQEGIHYLKILARE
jgi:chorismate mutase